MERVVKKSLEDILTAISEIDSFFEDSGRHFDSFQKDLRLRRAVQMNIAIIGEAMNRVLKLEPNVRITSARKIVDTRNYVIHGYDSLNDTIIWGIVVRYLPMLRDEVENILKEGIL